jgi:ABC-type amino acid transport substrate-binding protein
MFNQGLLELKAGGDYNRIIDKVVHGAETD